MFFCTMECEDCEDKKCEHYITRSELIQKYRKELMRLNNIIDELEDFITIRKARWENEQDYSQWYLEGYDNAIQVKHLSHSGVMLESLKSSSIKTCNDILNKLKELKENK